MEDLFQSDTFLFIIFGLVSVGIIGVGILFGQRQRARMRESYDQVAMRTGLRLEPGNFFSPPKLTGEYEGRTANLHTFTRSHGKSSTTYTRITLAVSNPTGNSIGLSPTNFLSGLGTMLGMQDVTIGDEDFDKKFVIKSKPPEYAATILSDQMITADLKQLTGSFDLELQGGSLTYTIIGIVTDAEKLMLLLTVMKGLADQIEGKKKGSF